LDGEAERREETSREQLDPLGFVQVTGAGKKRLETRLVLRDGASTPTIRELEEWGRAQGRSKPQIEEVCEATPRRCALIRLHLHVPELRLVVKVVRCHPYLLLHDPLLVEIGLATVDEDEGILRAVVLRKVHLLKLRRPIVMVLAGARPGGGGRRAIRSEGGDGLGIGCDRGLQLLHGIGEGLDLIGVTHGGGG